MHPYTHASLYIHASIQPLKPFGLFWGFVIRGSFKKDGSFSGAGEGQMSLLWGTELGAKREQSLISWDYDVDVAIYLKKGCDWDAIWNMACIQLKKLGYFTMGKKSAVQNPNTNLLTASKLSYVTHLVFKSRQHPSTFAIALE